MLLIQIEVCSTQLMYWAKAGYYQLNYRLNWELKRHKNLASITQFSMCEFLPFCAAERQKTYYTPKLHQLCSRRRSERGRGRGNRKKGWRVRGCTQLLSQSYCRYVSNWYVQLRLLLGLPGAARNAVMNFWAEQSRAESGTRWVKRGRGGVEWMGNRYCCNCCTEVLLKTCATASCVEVVAHDADTRI